MRNSWQVVFPANGWREFVLDCMLTHMITQATISAYLGEI